MVGLTLCIQRVVCSSPGVSAQSFIHAFTLTSSTFNVYLTTPEVSERGKEASRPERREIGREGRRERERERERETEKKEKE